MSTAILTPNADLALVADLTPTATSMPGPAELGILPVETAPIPDNPFLSALLWGGNYWDVGEAGVIEYSFWESPEAATFDDPYLDIATQTYAWFDYEIEAMQLALQTWADVAAFDFVQVENSDANATFGLYLVDSDDLGLGSLGAFMPPGEDGMGIGYFNWDTPIWTEANLQQGGYSFVTLIHEIGHGLGLAHPHDLGGGSTLFPGVDSAADIGLDGLNQGIWTTMSYNDGWQGDDLPFGAGYGYQGTPMAFDIAAVQLLYGANLEHNTGDDVYALPTENASGTFYACIWDAGGNDTISLGEHTLIGGTINLNDAPLVGPNAGGYLSSADGIYGGFTIANGVTIENATGGAGDDVLIGNEADNLLKGWNGDDRLFGDAGDDELWGWQGNDELYGGAGNDLLRGGGGDDWLDGWTGDDRLEGWTGNDTLWGYSGNDILLGGTGNDTLWGESGNDYLDGFGGEHCEQDTLLGGTGADAFVLGDHTDVFYSGDGFDGYATIVDFNWLEGDKVQLSWNGYSMGNYSLGKSQNLGGGNALDTGIYFQGDIIGVVQDTTDFYLGLDVAWV